MIYCCGKYREPFKTVFLPSDFKYRDRKLEIIQCEHCNSIAAVLTQFNIKTKKYETYRPRRKYTPQFLKEIESGKWLEVKIKYGTIEKAGFVYGVNKECKNGDIHQYSADFNGTRKLVKVVKNNGWKYGKKKEKCG